MSGALMELAIALMPFLNQHVQNRMKVSENPQLTLHGCRSIPVNALSTNAKEQIFSGILCNLKRRWTSGYGDPLFSMQAAAKSFASCSLLSLWVLRTS